ncbi:AlkD_like [Proteiniphilum saccharofermentans]|uniref:AlkD_like n=1 Tax=Proteiniphilum saccharofermentans TaxID=1642647 RepID=A0A1R3TCV2_9BACT|nr:MULTISPECIES: DNA alkylation repair protein [Proteiniphilum]SCD21434.1 AlkD_like [Proteiniphilum saccharofermentans]SFL23907.1 3-methyladenine DNA glycosylase AlkD [Porphyromonadaceae bacterium KH3CP3RA]
METILRNIRADLRMSMNGVTAASMRSKGVGYRMNFGVDVPRLKQIAARYVPDKVLAEIMWKEDVRELKILATMLCPPVRFSKEDAERWVQGAANQEIREQVCKNLFQELSYADELVQEWTGNKDETIRTTGYWLFARLCIIRSDAINRIRSEELLERAKADLKNESLLLRQSALNTLKFFGRLSPDNAEKVMWLVADFEYSVDPQEKEIFDLLSFEFKL